MANNVLRKGTLVVASAALALSLAACGGKEATKPAENQGAAPAEQPKAEQPKKEEPKAAKLAGDIKIDGSSTVYPISQAVAEEFMKKNKDVKITVGLAGSSNGFKKLISEEIIIADASRKIKPTEIEELKKKNFEAIEMPVAYDGITVVVNKKNTFAKEMTVEELNKIWAKDSKIKKWSEVRAGWPDKEIKLYGPGTASGTFEYFTEEINKKAKESRTDYTASEDDNVLVKGVESDEFAMGYFGFSYYLEHKDKLNAVAIKVDAASPAVAPTTETIENGTYKPLGRPIFIYPRKDVLERPEVKEFLKFYMSAEGQKLVEAVGYVKLPQKMYDENLAHLK
ncbi:phosphate ABC transporter substrate-binding protein PstS family protein [Paenibacillus turpanensis]|uniref:phosphate ABC transporter substrate-binding protein PstS family protein n=1 Tax=Paenibacillus turpanensis TaxID=2689078 RepID=UPI00140DFE59